MTATEARDYLTSVGIPIELVTVKRYTTRGWRWYAANPGQMLTDADLIVFAMNEREIRS
jgi:hypothetical protein